MAASPGPLAARLATGRPLLLDAALLAGHRGDWDVAVFDAAGRAIARNASQMLEPPLGEFEEPEWVVQPPAGRG